MNPGNMMVLRNLCTFSFSILLVFSLISSLCFANPDNFGLHDLAGIFSAFGGEDSCSYKCKSGDEQPIENPHHIPSSNGCGSYGIKLDIASYEGFVGCCDTHDMCYDKCNQKKQYCDDVFRECLTSACTGLPSKKNNKKKECKGMADIMYSATVGFGCQSYLDSQSNACHCKRPPSQKSIEL